MLLSDATFAQNFAPGTDTLIWTGYTTSDRITYRIEDISDPQQVFDGFDKQRRQRPIRRAAKVLQPVDDLSPQTFARFHADYWASRGQRDLLSQDFIIRVIETALGHGQGILLGLNDGDGIHGSVLGEDLGHAHFSSDDGFHD